MKCIILLTLVALCYSSSPYGFGYKSWYGYGSGLGSGYGGKMFINPDGSITVAGGNGKKVTISKNIDQTGVAISVTDPFGVSNSQYYQSWNKYTPYQDTLTQILSQYQGEVSPYIYQKLLGEVYAAVQTGQLNKSVYQTLQNLIGQTQEGYWGSQVGYVDTPYQQFFKQQQMKQGFPMTVTGFQYPYGQIGNVEGGSFPIDVYQQAPVFGGRYPSMGGYMSGIQGGFGQPTIGKTNWSNFYKYLLSGKVPQYGYQYNQYYPYSQQVGPMGQYVTEKLSGITEGESEILDQQSQIQQEQWQQQKLQQQLLEQQLQQQYQQKYLQELQQDVQQEQEQVLDLQKQQQYGVLMSLLKGTMPYGKTNFWQQLPRIYNQGGLYGSMVNPWYQGFSQYNIPTIY